MSIGSIEDDLELSLSAVRRAADVLRPLDPATVGTRYKSPDQVVSDADLAVDGALSRELLDARPGYGWRSEESGDEAGRAPDHPWWIVDPIDATHAYLAGDGDYTICVGQVRDGVPVLGVVMNPFRGELYYAVQGGGAFRVADGGEPDRLDARGDPPTAEPRVIVSSGEAAAFESWRPDWRVEVETGTAWKMILVARGLADAFCTPGRRFEWDVCGPAAICAETGCRVTDADGRPFGYALPDPGVDGVVVAGSGLHARAVSRLKSN